MRAQYTVDCQHPKFVMDVLGKIEELIPEKPVHRQDGECIDSTFCVSIGTRYLQFYNIPKNVEKALDEASEKAKASILPKKLSS